MAARVAEPHGAVEYVASVALSELAGLTVAQQKARLGAAVKAERDRSLAAVVELNMTGTVEV